MGRGGARENAGRKKVRNKKVTISFTLDPELAEFLRSQGNVSATLEKLIKDLRKLSQ